MTGLSPTFADATADGIELAETIRAIVRDEVAAQLADRARREWLAFEAVARAQGDLRNGAA